jgi:undecaprenyl phosphate N,N'-diacetylbacillosamine 1-phosphate transferase
MGVFQLLLGRQQAILTRDKVGVDMLLKRTADTILSILLLLITSPLLLLICLAIRLSSRGPVVFVQERVGKDRRVFNLYKFRTMAEGAENKTRGNYISEDEVSLTPIGRVLRRYALDELPQLMNVIKGDMSLVGPRPTLGYQVEKYDARQLKRLDVKPGITGWAQVNGRNKLSWPERIEFDVWYVENRSSLLDAGIILRTVPALLKKDYAFSSKNADCDDIVKL